MRPLTKPQMEIIDVLAHVSVAAELSANVEGFGGFYRHYVDNDMTQRQREIWSHFQSRIPEVKRDMVRLLKESE